MQVINTLKCNLKCEHCLFSCSPSRKGYLDYFTLRKFLSLTSDNFCNYCGGETFLNPEWRDHLRLLSEQCDQIRIVSNGTTLITKLGNPTKALGDFIELMGILSHVDFTLCISSDIWHDAALIDYGHPYSSDTLSKKVKEYIEENYYGTNFSFESDGRMDRIRRVVGLGRAAKTGVFDHDQECSLSENLDDFELTLLPSGKISSCCNGYAIIGDVQCSKDDLVIANRNLLKRKPKTCLECSRKRIK